MLFLRVQEDHESIMIRFPGGFVITFGHNTEGVRISTGYMHPAVDPNEDSLLYTAVLSPRDAAILTRFLARFYEYPRA